MKITAWRGSLLSMAILTGFLGPAAAQSPAPTNTIWRFFGIPQAWEATQDAHLNRLGNNPKRERVPPLKKIADPENLKSPNPAIKTAAKIKAESDLVPQKIKAIKYLGTIACCCPANKDKIKAALFAALSDCNAGVRQAAAEAICYAAGNRCSVCNTCSCCGADVMNKLAEMSEGKTPSGCWLEPSEAVRTAAANALASCRSVKRPEPASSPTPDQPVPHEERAPIGPPRPKAPAASTTPTAVPVIPRPALLSPPPTGAKPAPRSAQAGPVDASMVDLIDPRGSASEPAGYAEAVSGSEEPAPAKVKITTIPSVEKRKVEALPVSFGPEIQPIKP
jgi:hypothetical protein